MLWSPQAEELFGYTAQEALGRYAARLLVHEQHLDLMIRLFSEVTRTGRRWARRLPCPAQERPGWWSSATHGCWTTGVTSMPWASPPTRRSCARWNGTWPLSTRLVAQSPIGLVVLDTDLRYVAVNPALAQINGVPAEDHLGRQVREALPFLEVDAIEAALRQVLASGKPLIDQQSVGRTPADPGNDHAWSVSYYRLDGPGGRVLGVAIVLVDVTDRHRARQRLALIADGSARIGTTLDVEQTARELADVAVPEVADVAAVDILDSVLDDCHPTAPGAGRALFRALAVKAAYPAEAVRAADPPGHLASYGAERLATQCVRTGRPILIPHVGERDLARIARDAEAGALLARAGIHRLPL